MSQPSTPTPTLTPQCEAADESLARTDLPLSLAANGEAKELLNAAESEAESRGCALSAEGKKE